MNHTILFIGYDPMVEPEIREYIGDKASRVFFAFSTEEAIKILEENPIETALLNFRSLKDAVIMRYINRYYAATKVVVSASHGLDEIIDTFNKGHFSLMDKPLTLSELNSSI